MCEFAASIAIPFAQINLYQIHKHESPNDKVLNPLKYITYILNIFLWAVFDGTGVKYIYSLFIKNKD